MESHTKQRTQHVSPGERDVCDCTLPMERKHDREPFYEVKLLNPNNRGDRGMVLTGKSCTTPGAPLWPALPPPQSTGGPALVARDNQHLPSPKFRQFLSVQISGDLALDCKSSSQDNEGEILCLMCRSESSEKIVRVCLINQLIKGSVDCSIINVGLQAS